VVDAAPARRRSSTPPPSRGFPKNKTTLVSETAAASAALAIRFSDEWNKEAQNGRGRKNQNEGREPNKSLVVALVGVGARSAWASAVRFSADQKRV
jgi:hypothetical protein